MRLIGVLMMSIVLSAGAAEPAPEAPDVQAYLASLQTKLDHAARRANQPTAGGSSVIGLRGSKKEASGAPSAKSLYWKSTEPAPPTVDEIKELRAAVALAQNGQTSEAKSALAAFKKKYPASALTADADEALRRL